MPLLHLIDRPEGVPYAFEQRQQRVGALASVASHGAVLLLLVAVAQITREAAVTTPLRTFDPRGIVWPVNLDPGGGQQGGGNLSKTPARRQQLPGKNDTSAAGPTKPSLEATTEPPVEHLPISARPTGEAFSVLPGPVTGEPVGESLGRNSGPGGNGDGPTSGDGSKPGRGIGDGIGARGPGVTAPVVVTQVKPSYTAEAMRAKVQGLVMVECVVMPDGTVGDARIVRSLDPRFGLDQEAITAAKKWRFKPGLLNGTPVPVIVTIELSFTLR
jgi:TonB family protein